MTTEEREMILNLSYEELIEKFKNEPQKVIKFLHEEQKKDVSNDTEYIIEKMITLIMIIIRDINLSIIRIDLSLSFFCSSRKNFINTCGSFLNFSASSR